MSNCLSSGRIVQTKPLQIVLDCMDNASTFRNGFSTFINCNFHFLQRKSERKKKHLMTGFELHFSKEEWTFCRIITFDDFLIKMLPTARVPLNFMTCEELRNAWKWRTRKHQKFQLSSQTSSFISHFEVNSFIHATGVSHIARTRKILFVSGFMSRSRGWGKGEGI